MASCHNGQWQLTPAKSSFSIYAGLRAAAGSDATRKLRHYRDPVYTVQFLWSDQYTDELLGREDDDH